MWEKRRGFTPHEDVPPSPPPIEPVSQWTIAEKNKRGKGEIENKDFWKPLGILRFLLYPWKFQTKQGFTLINFTKLCYTPQKFQGLKLRLLDIPHNVFLMTPRNSTLSLISPPENPAAISSITLEILYPQPPAFFLE